MSLIKEIKQVCLKLVGQWHSKEEDATLIFDFSDNLKDKFPFTIILKDKTSVKSFYEVRAFPGTDKNNQYQFYIWTGVLDKQSFLIESLSDDEVIFTALNGYEKTEHKSRYVRVVDFTFADDILKELD